MNRDTPQSPSRRRTLTMIFAGLATVSGLPSMPVHAAASGSIVFDPTQFAEMLVQSEHMVRQNAAMVKDYVVQAEQLLMAKRKYEQFLKDIQAGRISTLKGLQREIVAGRDLYDRMGNVNSSLSQLRNYSDNFRAQAAGYNMTPTNFYNTANTTDWFRNAHLKEEFQSRMALVQATREDIDQLQSIQSDIRFADGQRAQMMLMNQQLNKLGGQMANLVLLIAKQQGTNSAESLVSTNERLLQRQAAWSAAERERVAIANYKAWIAAGARW